MTAESQLTVYTTSETTTDVAATPPRVDSVMTAADAAGSWFTNDGTIMFLVTAGAADSLSITSENSCNFRVAHGVTYGPMTSPRQYIFGPFAVGHYNDAYQKTHITWSATPSASTKILAFKPGPTMG
jgi:hypothetical protein